MTQRTRRTAILALVLASVAGMSTTANLAHADGRRRRPNHHPRQSLNVQVGPRPYFLTNDMDEGPLKDKLLSCREDSMRPSLFSIGHRGAALQFPEETAEAIEGGARMGAGILECDVTFTKDRQLVCRHSQCDLHTTTNILTIPALAAKCTAPFTPADPATGRLSPRTAAPRRAGVGTRPRRAP